MVLSEHLSLVPNPFDFRRLVFRKCDRLDNPIPVERARVFGLFEHLSTMSFPEKSSETVNRRAILVVLSLLAFGLVNVVRALLWGANPLWGLVMLPPILLLTAFGWLAFKSERGRERAN